MEIDGTVAYNTMLRKIPYIIMLFILAYLTYNYVFPLVMGVYAAVSSINILGGKDKSSANTYQAYQDASITTNSVEDNNIIVEGNTFTHNNQQTLPVYQPIKQDQ